MVEAARPFRAGTRFQALPDVRFLVDGGRIRAPGDLLPGPQDITAQRYGERLDHQMGGRGRLLVVEQPLILDHALWAQVRSLVAPLWERAGYPVLPVVTELVLGERITECDGPAHELRHSTLTWVLHGTVTATPRDAQAGPTLTAGAGDLLHWPAGQPRAPDEVFRAAVHGSRSARLDGRMPSHVQFMVERVHRTSRRICCPPPTVPRRIRHPPRLSPRRPSARPRGQWLPHFRCRLVVARASLLRRPVGRRRSAFDGCHHRFVPSAPTSTALSACTRTASPRRHL